MVKNRIFRFIILIISIFCLMMIFLNTFSYAEELDLGDLNKYVEEPTRDPVTFQAKANRFIEVIQVVGSIASVITLIIIGIRYMFSSVEEKAEFKKTAMGYVIGCVMVFAIVNLLNIIYDIARSF